MLVEKAVGEVAAPVPTGPQFWLAALSQSAKNLGVSSQGAWRSLSSFPYLGTSSFTYDKCGKITLAADKCRGNVVSGTVKSIIQRSYKPKHVPKVYLSWSVSIQEEETLVLLVAHWPSCISIILLIRMSFVCVCVCVWERERRTERQREREDPIQPCQFFNLALSLCPASGSSLIPSSLTVQQASSSPYMPSQESEQSWPDSVLAPARVWQSWMWLFWQPCRELTKTGKQEGPALLCSCDIRAKIALMSCGRETGIRDRKNLSHIRTELWFTIQINFPGHFYGEIWVVLESSAIA